MINKTPHDARRGALRALATVAIAGAIIVPLGRSSADAGPVFTDTSQGQVETKAVDGYTEGLPADIVPLYENALDPLGPSPYREWKPKSPPWTVCFENSYIGNSWRADTLEQWNQMVEEYKSAGLVDTAYAENSNLSVPTAISQMNNMITAYGCDAILLISSGTSGMNAVIERAYQAGIPVILDQQPQTTAYGQNYDENFYGIGKSYLEFFDSKLKGDVNILNVVGIPAETLSVMYQTALKDFVKEHPNFHVVGEVTGNVTDSVAKQAVLQFLSTHPGEVHAVYQEGGMGAGILQAFEQAGRPLPAMGDIGAGGFLSVWHSLVEKGEHPNFIGLSEPPKASMRQAFRVMIMILEGQHPKNMTILFRPPEITEQNLNGWWNESLTPSSTNYPEPDEDIMPMSDLFPYFFDPKPTVPFEGKGSNIDG